jgi:hypothetical protein
LLLLRCRCSRVASLLLHHQRKVCLLHVAGAHLPQAQLLRACHARMHSGCSLHACRSYAACLHELHLCQLLLLCGQRLLLLLLGVAEAWKERQGRHRGST